jgi:high frequency lysogenization protein
MLLPSTSFTNQVYLISGLYQCAELIHLIATTGKCSYQDYKHIIRVLNVKKFSSIADVFDGEDKLKQGLIACAKYFSMKGGDYTATIYVNRYFTEMIKLESALRKKPSLMGKVAERVAENEVFFKDLDKHMTDLIQNYAAVYSEIISPNTPKIIIKGEANHLKQEFNAQKVRALLLASLRLVVLWYQIGGKQWHLFIRRKKIIDTCLSLQQNF